MVNNVGKTVISGLAAISILSILIFIMNFNLFDDDKPVEIANMDSGDPNYKISVSYSPSNVTIQEQIVVTKSYKNGGYKLLANFERYQILVSSQIINDTIIIVLADTSSYIQRRDKLKIPIK